MRAVGWGEPELQSALRSASREAAHIEDLWWVFFWVCAVVWVLVVAAAMSAVWRASSRNAPDVATPVPEPGSERALQIWTGGAAGATLLLLFVLLVASSSTGRALAARPPADALRLEITGQRWWWLVEYPMDPPSQSVTTANEVHVPVGRAVSIALESRDVVHSLWVPELQGKRDLIPGIVNELHFTALRPGVYRGQCAEFCGLQHAHMGLVVVAEPPERFEAWLAEQRAPAAAPSGEAARGERVFLSSSCPMCHTIRGTAAAGSVGPDLTHLMSRSTLAAASLPNTPRALADWISDPHAAKLGTQMPPIFLSPGDRDALLAYLTGLK
jgi:cytochrome c oxidase subunit 2